MAQEHLMDWSGCSQVEQVPGKVSGVPILKGTRVQAEAVLGNYALGETPESISEIFDLNLEQVRAVLKYALDRMQDQHH